MESARLNFPPHAARQPEAEAGVPGPRTARVRGAQVRPVLGAGGSGEHRGGGGRRATRRARVSARRRGEGKVDSILIKSRQATSAAFDVSHTRTVVRRIPTRHSETGAAAPPSPAARRVSATHRLSRYLAHPTSTLSHANSHSRSASSGRPEAQYRAASAARVHQAGRAPGDRAQLQLGAPQVAQLGERQRRVRRREGDAVGAELGETRRGPARFPFPAPARDATDGFRRRP